MQNQVMNTKAIIFDFGDVIDVLDDKQAWLDVREAVAAQLGMTGEEMWRLFYKNPLWEQVKRGHITNEDYWDGILRPFGYTNRTAQQAFIDKLFEKRADINADMVALLHELKPHYRLAILSNTFRRDMEDWLINTHGLNGIFDVVVSSADVGLAKPEPEIYQLALRRLGVAPSEALFIDDLERNTSAAQALGIPAIIFEAPAQLRRELASRGILVSAGAAS